MMESSSPTAENEALSHLIPGVTRRAVDQKAVHAEPDRPDRLHAATCSGMRVVGMADGGRRRRGEGARGGADQPSNAWMVAVPTR